MRVFFVIAFIALFALASARQEQAVAHAVHKFEPKLFAKCLVGKLGITLDKAVGCAYVLYTTH
jgi:hypothetical protein